MKSLKRVLIANRGEIAVRVIRACREMGITSIAVFSDPDRSSLHVQLADEAISLPGNTVTETYLDHSKILEIARRTKADGIHPGYGFLSENPVFAENVERAGLTFIGPSGRAIRALGDKTEARRMARQLGIPTVPGTHEPLSDEHEALEAAKRIGYPVLLKAAAGGGGKGMRIIRSDSEMKQGLKTARSEAKSAFGDDRIYLEKYLHAPRHIEIQILGDSFGHMVHLGERECSIQRRHQKVLEESPSPVVDPVLRAKMGGAAVQLVASSRYVNAGTVEFVVDADMNFHFLEMNTRLQVEHPVTEAVTGIDLVQQQIHIAEGGTLEFSQNDIRQTGHALECRIYAEDPDNSFFPSTGILKHYAPPQGPRIRVDNGFQTGDRVHIYYDPMLAKVISWGKDRNQSIQTMKRALSEFQIDGVRTTIPFCMFVLEHPDFIKGSFDTSFVDTRFPGRAIPVEDPLARIAAILAAVKFRETHLNNVPVTENHSDGIESKWKKLRLDSYRS